MTAPPTAPTALMPSQSATRRLPGLPARASRFSVRLLERAARDPRHPAGQPAGERAERPLEERRLELELLEVLGLHRAQLGQPGLDRVDRRAAGEAHGDEQDGSRRGGGDEDRDDGRHLLDLDVDDAADQHEADEHHEPAEREDDHAERQPEASGGFGTSGP